MYVSILCKNKFEAATAMYETRISRNVRKVQTLRT